MAKYSVSTPHTLKAAASGSSARIRCVSPRRLPDLPTLSRQAKWRLAILDYAKTHTVSATCRHFGIARSTYYYWKARYNPKQLTTLETRSSRPKRVRSRRWTVEQIEAVKQLREQYPRWGKDKLAVLLRRRAVAMSVSMVGRIIRYLKDRGVLIEPRAVRVSHSRHKRPYAVRKPKEYTPTRPGDLIQIDTMELRPLPGVVRYQLTAVDVVSRYSVVGVRSCASSGTATEFLAEVLERMPFEVRSLQVDGGSEFMAGFEAWCQQQELPLWVLPPRSPKLNGCVERGNRAHRNEFWECYDGELALAQCQEALREWEEVYNRIRPHQALGYLTPAEYLRQLQTVA